MIFDSTIWSIACDHEGCGNSIDDCDSQNRAEHLATEDGWILSDKKHFCAEHFDDGEIEE